MKLRIHGVSEVYDGLVRTGSVERTGPLEHADFWSVYRVDESGHEHWEADFKNEWDAQYYVEVAEDAE